MALIHTIQVVSEKSSRSTVSSTRKSETRKYLACIVATTTEASLRIDAEKKAKVEKELVEAKARVTELSAKFGMTPEQAKAKHEVECERWFNRVDGWHETRRKYLYDANGHYRQVGDHVVRADMEKRGLIYPWDKESTYGIVEAQQTLIHCENQLERWAKLTVGSQAVLSWHGTTTLASKAMTSRDCEWARKNGDTLEIRTDITITETKKRAPKA